MIPQKKREKKAGWSFQVYITINTALPKEEGHLLVSCPLLCHRCGTGTIYI